MDDIEKQKERIINELFNSKIVTAIVNQNAYQRGIPRETGICDDGVQQVFLTLSKMKADKLIELYKHDADLYRLKNYIGSIVKTSVFGMKKEDDRQQSFISKLFYGSTLKGANDCENYSDVWESSEAYNEENKYTELWNEKILPKLTEDEKDFLNFWFATARKAKPRKIRVLYEKLVRKIKLIVTDQPLPKSRKNCYKIPDDIKQALMAQEKKVRQTKSKGHRPAKTVYQFTMDGVFIQQFESAKEVMEKTGVTPFAVSRAANGRIKGAGGFKWSYTKPDA